KRAAAFEHAMHGGERGLEIALAKEGLKNPVWRDDERKRACHAARIGTRCEWQMSNVTANQAHTIRQSGASDSRVRAIEHGSRSIDADQRHASTSQRERDATCPASKLEDAAARIQRDVAPERHVAAAERPCILPVVEGRVVVPAFPTITAL